MSRNIPLDTVLTTPRCRLRAPSEADIPFVFSATRFPGFNDGMLWEPPATLEALHGPLVAGLTAWAAGTAYTFTLEAKENADFIGRIGIRKAEEVGAWTMGYWVHPSAQGKGYATEAATRVLEFGFEVLEATVIDACHATWNRSSRRVLEKAGMSFVRHLPRGFQKHGVWVAEDCLSVSRAGWLAR